MKPTHIIIHHSLTTDNLTVSWSAIRDYHIVACGWHDIGYHYGIEKIGTRYEILKGRMDTDLGAHCLGFNDRSIGICRVGNFDLEKPDEEGTLLLLKLCRSLMLLHTISVENVIGHWETYALLEKPIEKTCPGKLFNMATFRRML